MNYTDIYSNYNNIGLFFKLTKLIEGILNPPTHHQCRGYFIHWSIYPYDADIACLMGLFFYWNSSTWTLELEQVLPSTTYYTKYTNKIILPEPGMKGLS